MSGKYYYEAAPPPLRSAQSTITSQSKNIATMIQNAGGKILLSRIKSDYEKKYGKKIILPKTGKAKKIKHFIENNVPGDSARFILFIGWAYTTSEKEGIARS